ASRDCMPFSGFCSFLAGSRLTLREFCMQNRYQEETAYRIIVMLEAPRHPALPTSFPRYDTPPLIGHRKPRCPPYVEVSSVDQLMPYLDVVARRPYNQG